MSACFWNDSYTEEIFDKFHLLQEYGNYKM